MGQDQPDQPPTARSPADVPAPVRKPKPLPRPPVAKRERDDLLSLMELLNTEPPPSMRSPTINRAGGSTPILSNKLLLSDDRRESAPNLSSSTKPLHVNDVPRNPLHLLKQFAGWVGGGTGAGGGGHGEGLMPGGGDVRAWSSGSSSSSISPTPSSSSSISSGETAPITKPTTIPQHFVFTLSLEEAFANDPWHGSGSGSGTMKNHAVDGDNGFNHLGHCEINGGSSGVSDGLISDKIGGDSGYNGCSRIIGNPIGVVGGSGPDAGELVSSSQQCEKSNFRSLSIPRIVVSCISHLENVCGLETEGLYRIPGSVKRVREWVDRVEVEARTNKTASQGIAGVNRVAVMAPSALGSRDSENQSYIRSEKIEQVVATPIPEPARAPELSLSTTSTNLKSNVFDFGREGAPTVASLLKRFMSLIQGGLVDERFWIDLDQVVKTESNRSRSNDMIKSFLKQRLRPGVHYDTFAFYINHLHRVSRHSEKNMMNSRNLSVCLFPNGLTGAEIIIERAPEIFCC